MGDSAGARRGANQLCLPGLTSPSHSGQALTKYEGGSKSLCSPAKSGGRGNAKPCTVSHGRSQEAGRGKAQHKPAAASHGGRGKGAAQHQSQPPPGTTSAAAVVATATKQLAVTKVSQLQQKEQKKQVLQTARQKHGEGDHVPIKQRDHTHHSAASSSKMTKVVTIIEKHITVNVSRKNNKTKAGT